MLNICANTFKTADSVEIKLQEEKSGDYSKPRVFFTPYHGLYTSRQ